MAGELSERGNVSVFRVKLSHAIAPSFIIKSGCLGGYEENPPWPVVDMRVNLAAEKRHSAFVEPMGIRVIASATNILNGLEFLVFRWQAFRPHGVNVFLQDRPRGLAVLGGEVERGIDHSIIATVNGWAARQQGHRRGQTDIVLQGAEVRIERRSTRAEKVEEFREKFANPYIAAGRGFIDEIIRPRETRRKLIAALRNLENKRDKNPPKKHGNIPL